VLSKHGHSFFSLGTREPDLQQKGLYG